MMSREEFWNMTSTERWEAEYEIDRNLAYLETASIETLRTIFHEYRFFIKYYINDLGLLLYKTPFSRFKCMVAEIASDELGEDADKTHLYLWDKFLISMGMTEEELEVEREPKNIRLLEGLSDLMMSETFMYAVGLRGMGAECLCQVYLAVTHKHLLRNPYVIAHKNEIDWIFWDIHTGEIDIAHGEMVRDAIDEIIVEKPETIGELAAGYLKGKETWDLFWKNIYALTDLTRPATVVA